MNLNFKMSHNNLTHFNGMCMKMYWNDNIQTPITAFLHPWTNLKTLRKPELAWHGNHIQTLMDMSYDSTSSASSTVLVGRDNGPRVAKILHNVLWRIHNNWSIPPSVIRGIQFNFSSSISSYSLISAPFLRGVQPPSRQLLVVWLPYHRPVTNQASLTEHHADTGPEEQFGNICTLKYCHYK